MLFLGVVWGFSFLFIKVADETLAPLQVAFGRVLCGMVALLVVQHVSGSTLPKGIRAWGHLAVAALFLNTVPFTLFAYGETHVSAVAAGIWNATTALFTLPIALLMIPGERARPSRVVGLGVGFAGVLVVLGVWSGGLSGSSIEGHLLCIGAAASYGVGIPYSQRFLLGRGDQPLSLATGQLVMGSIQLAVVSLALTGAPHSLPARVVVSVLLLGVLGTGIAFVVSYSLTRDVGATVSSTVTYLIPVFSTAAGVVILGEHLRWNEPVGAVVILVGAALTTGRLQPAFLLPRRSQAS
ncbi:MAG: DMT family transporter [Acidimicrobiales bacterium]